MEFYNRIVALRLRNMVRRLDPGARIETGRIGDNAVTLVHMTPDMRRRLVTDGLPIMVNPPTGGIAAVFASTGSREQDMRERAIRYRQVLERARRAAERRRAP